MVFNAAMAASEGGFSTSRMNKPPSLTYGLEDRPSLPLTLLLRLQHTLAMSSTLVLVAVILPSTAWPTSLAQDVVRLSMIGAGVGTILQAMNRFGVGTGYLCPQLVGPAFVPASLLAVKTGGLALLYGMTIVTGLFQAILSRFLQRMRFLFPTEVVGVIVAMVGVVLIPLGVSAFFGDTVGLTVIRQDAVLTAAGTFSLMVGLTVWGRGMLRLFSLLIGVGVGLATAYGLDLLSEEDLVDFNAAPLFELPHPLTFNGLSFDLELLIPFLAAGLASSLKGIGDLTTCQRINDAEWVRPDMGSLSKGVLADSLGVAFTGLLGGIAPSTSSSNVGLSIATRATSRWIAFSAGAIFIALAFIPKLATVFVIMPSPVRGAILLYVACFMIVAGLQIVTSRMLDSRKIFIIGISLIAGLSVYVTPEAYGEVPNLLEPLVGSALALCTIVALALNLLFRIGISKRALLVLPIGPDAIQKVLGFTEDEGGKWGARSDVIYRVTGALTEFMEAASELDLVQDDVKINLSFDEMRIVADIRYRGEPLPLPTSRPSQAELLESDPTELGLHGLLLRHYATRVRLSSRDEEIRLLLTFDH